MRLRTGPLAWGFGAALGAALALILGPHGPSWGTALAFPSAALLLAIGTFWEGPEDRNEPLTHLLRLTLGFTAGFLVATVPLTLARLAAFSAPGAPGSVRVQVHTWRVELAARWAVIALALLSGGTALYLRRRRG